MNGEKLALFLVFVCFYLYLYRRKKRGEFVFVNYNTKHREKIGHTSYEGPIRNESYVENV